MAQFSAQPTLAASFPDSPLDQQLCEAARQGQTRRVVSLINKGANPNACSADGLTPLLYTLVSTGSLRGMKALLKCGADPNWIPTHGTPVAIAAVELPHSRVLELFFQHGLNPNLTVDDEPLLVTASHCLHTAATEKALLNAGANVNARTRDGSTALPILVSLQQWSRAWQLLKYGADPRLITQTGTTVGWLTHANRPQTATIPHRYPEFIRALTHAGIAIPGPSPQDIRQHWQQYGEYDRLPHCR
jgi:ankyrin repeat protein